PTPRHASDNYNEVNSRLCRAVHQSLTFTGKDESPFRCELLKVTKGEAFMNDVSSLNHSRCEKAWGRVNG
ncbi:MAG: hypothetical protein KKA41_17410, partial [Proteobacteria bacterium]|nr:hypothetical protein [Pseudomonadota bacterium]